MWFQEVYPFAGQSDSDDKLFDGYVSTPPAAVDWMPCMVLFPHWLYVGHMIYIWHVVCLLLVLEVQHVLLHLISPPPTLFTCSVCLMVFVSSVKGR